jgi:hypothetical protein
MADPAVVTAADIARLAGVTRGTVSNWRRRHADFPSPVGGTDASPAYRRAEVEDWLAARGALPELPPLERLWRAATDAAAEEDLGSVISHSATALILLAAIGVVDQAGPAGSAAADGLRARRDAGSLGEASNARGRFDEVLEDVAREIGATPALRGLIDRYSDVAGISITPKPVADLMAELAVPAGGTVLDPACGTGELLVAALDRGAARVRGQELDPALERLASSRLSTRLQPWRADDGPIAAYVRGGDSLLADKFPRLRPDAVLCHPPFGTREWGQNELVADPRWKYGLPPKSEPELAWAQHALAHLKPGGRAVMLMPPALASRPSARRIRAELLRRGALRAVISLPAGVVRPVHVPVHLWVLDRPGGTDPVDPRVLLVDGASFADGDGDGSGAADGNDVSDGWPAVTAAVHDAWQAFIADEEATGEPGLWRAVRVIDVLDETVDLSPARHITPAEGTATPAQTAERTRALIRRLGDALDEVRAGLPGEDWPPAKEPPSWHMVTIAELARRGMAEFYRASSGTADIQVRAGDVLVRVEPGGPVRSAAARAGDSVAIVATVLDDGMPLGRHLHLIRPDTSALDPWFLAGFLAAPSSVQQASYGTSFMRIDARRLAVPLLPLASQREYGAVFRKTWDLDAAVAELADLASGLTELISKSLADGVLLPPESGGAGKKEQADE